jgi:hypothetical protein
MACDGEEGALGGGRNRQICRHWRATRG